MRSLLLLPLVLALASPSWAGRYAAAEPGEEVSDGLIVHLRGDRPFRGAKVPARFLTDARWRAMRLPNQHRVRVDQADHQAAGAALAADPAVELVEPDRIRRPSLTPPNDPKFSEQWNLSMVKAREAWGWFPGRYLTASLNLDRVRVAVLDTGADCTHPDFANAGNSSPDSAFGGQINFARSVALPGRLTETTPAACDWQDDHGHGTLVAGIVAAATNNGAGVASLGAMLELMIYKVTASNGGATDADLAEAIVDATDNGARVITMSLSGTGFSQLLQNACDYAWARNVILIGAVGNSGTTASAFPAANNHVIGTGAFNSTGAVASFSNRGIQIDVVAPGDSVPTTSLVAGGRYTALYHSASGTSMAAPHVAALAGLLAMASPGVTDDAVVRRIQRSADLPQDGWSPDFGYGRIDAERAITGANWRSSSLGGVSGQVQGAIGLAIAGATITLGSRSFTTEAGGLFRLTGIAPGDYTMTVASPGVTTLSVPVTISAGSDTPTQLRMGFPYGTFLGSVNAGGAPMAGAVVTAWQGGLKQGVAVTNAVGQYRLFLPVGAYEVRAGDMFTTTASVAGQTISAESNTLVPLLEPRNFGRQEGFIRNASNAAVNGAQILLSQAGRSFGAVSAGNGEYRTIPGPAGTYVSSADEPTAGSSTAAAVSIVDNTTGRLDMVLRTGAQVLSLNPSTAAYSAAGGPGSVTIAAGSSSLTWSATSNASWLGIASSTAGTGNSTLNYNVAPNPDTATRSARIQVNEATLTVTQTGATAAVSADPSSVSVSEVGGARTVAISSSGAWVAVSQDAWILVAAPSVGTGNGSLNFTAAANPSNLARTGRIRVNGATITVNQPGASLTLEPGSISLGAAEFTTGSIQVGVSSPGLPWSATADDNWITVLGAGFGQGNGIVPYRVAANSGTAARVGTISFTGATFTVTQTGASLSINPTSASASAGGGTGTFNVTASPASFAWTSSSNAGWVTFPAGSGQGNGTVTYSVAANTSTSARTAVISVGASAFTITQAGASIVSPPPVTGGSGLHFVPVTPCRLVDTRENLGAFGRPALASGSPRSFTPSSASCGIPASAKAYALNVTVVPRGFLGFIALFPTGQAQPLVSTLNSVDGRVKANAAIVPAGTGGAITVTATDPTDLVLDINGYFVEPGVSAAGLAFFPVTPCRVIDTRNAAGGGIPASGGTRLVPVLGSGCGIPASALAYSLNATVVPSGPLGFLTLWPSGQAQPFVSTLNAITGAVVANAAIVPAGTNGAINAFASSATHLVVDINGYFAPSGSGANAQRFFPVTPCRVADSRNAGGSLGGPILAGGQTRTWPIPSSACGLPASAGAYSLNATVVPVSGLGFLTMWPAGQSQPLVSTLNALDDPIAANAAIVVAGASGAISTFVTNQTHLIVDTNGYFAP